MTVRNLFQLLTLLSITVFITACPSVDPEDLVDLDGTITIVNNTSSTTFGVLNIDDSCTNNWSGESTISIGPNGGSASYNVNSSIATDTFDVRVCDNGKTTCYIWSNNAAVAGTSATLDTNSASASGVPGTTSC